MNSAWKVERDSHYYKIYDKKKHLAGYFAPEYGKIFPEEKADEIIEQMHKRGEKIGSGYLMIPMVKFGIFSEGHEMDLDYIATQVDEVRLRLSYWKDFLTSRNLNRHKITVSHTDHDMLSITLHIAFPHPVSLEKNSIQEEMGKILSPLLEMGLL